MPGYEAITCIVPLRALSFAYIQSTLVISASIISNNRLSRRENVVFV